MEIVGELWPQPEKTGKAPSKGRVRRAPARRHIEMTFQRSKHFYGFFHLSLTWLSVTVFPTVHAVNKYFWMCFTCFTFSCLLVLLLQCFCLCFTEITVISPQLADFSCPKGVVKCSESTSSRSPSEVPKPCRVFSTVSRGCMNVSQRSCMTWFERWHCGSEEE